MANKGYKAFRPGFYCEQGSNRKQYYENSIAEDIGANGCCKQGVMHYCEMPLDTLDYYPLIDNEGRMTEFAEVEPLDKVFSEGNKRACKKLKIGAKLSLKDLVSAQIGVVFEKAEMEKTKGLKNFIAKLASSGYGAQLASSGDGAKLASSGDDAQLASSGDGAQLASSGYGAKLASSGYGAKLASSGDDAVVAGIGRNNIAKAAIGSWIVLAEYGAWDGKRYPVLCVKAAQIDGETLKPDTWYKLENGEFAEATND